MKNLVFYILLLIVLIKSLPNLSLNDLNHKFLLTPKVKNTCLSGQYMLGIDIKMSQDNKTILNVTVKCGNCYAGCIKCKNSTKLGCRQCDGNKVLYKGDCLDVCPKCTKHLNHGVCVDVKCIPEKKIFNEIYQNVDYIQEKIENLNSLDYEISQNLFENKKSLKKHKMHRFQSKTQGVVSTWKSTKWNPIFETTAYMVPSSVFGLGCKLFKSCDFYNRELKTYEGVTNLISEILTPLKDLPDVGIFFTAIGDILDALDTILANIGDAMGITCEFAAVFTIPCKLMSAFTFVIRILEWIVLPILIAIDNKASSFLESKSKDLPTNLYQLFNNVENIFDPFVNFIMDFPHIPDITIFDSVFSTLDNIYSSLHSATTTISDIIDGSYGSCVGWWIFSVCYSIDGRDILNGLDGIYETLFSWVLDEINNLMHSLTSSVIDPILNSIGNINFPQITFPNPTNFGGYIQTIFNLAGQQANLMAMPGQTIGMWEAIPFSLGNYQYGACMRNDYTVVTSALAISNTFALEGTIPNCNYAWSVSWIDNENLYIINMGMQTPLCYNDNTTPVFGDPGCTLKQSAFYLQPDGGRILIQAKFAGVNQPIGDYLDLKYGPNNIIPDGSLNNVLSTNIFLMAAYVRLKTYFNTYMQFNGNQAGQASNINDYTTLFNLVLQPLRKVYICISGIWSFYLLNCNSDGSVSTLIGITNAPTALFTMIFSSDQQHVYFQAYNGLYLSAQPNGIFQCNRQVADIWETFTMLTDQFLVHIV